jgi:hypothetical protein
MLAFVLENQHARLRNTNRSNKLTFFRLEPLTMFAVDRVDVSLLLELLVVCLVETGMLEDTSHLVAHRNFDRVRGDYVAKLFDLWKGLVLKVLMNPTCTFHSTSSWS